MNIDPDEDIEWISVEAATSVGAAVQYCIDAG